jgi:radical SAM protein with 4Fe4S-binding SPASM domain
VYLHFDSQFEWPNKQLPVVGEKGFCYALDSHIGVLSDGTIIPCCLDAGGEISLGNIAVTSLAEALCSVRARQMREGFRERKLVEGLCRHCSFICRFG